MASFGHLASRFVGSLRPGGPGRSEEEWVAAQLTAAEAGLWRRMSGPDRRHAAQVARRVERALGHEATRPVIAAALLHDVGKVESGLRTYGRVVATLSAKVAGHDMAPLWREKRGFVRRVGLYLEHPGIGADLLAMAGSDPLTVTWAREHHDAPDTWATPRHLAEALASADDD